MKLKSGEEIVRSSKAQIKSLKMGEEEAKGFSQREGTLYITTRRVVMEKGESGSETIIFDIPLDSVRKVSTQGLFKKDLVLQADLSNMSSETVKLDKSRLSWELGTFLINVKDAKKWVAQLNFWLPKKESK